MNGLIVTSIDLVAPVLQSRPSSLKISSMISMSRRKHLKKLLINSTAKSASASLQTGLFEESAQCVITMMLRATNAMAAVNLLMLQSSSTHNAQPVAQPQKFANPNTFLLIYLKFNPI
jgi:hypothetical protein